MSIATDATEQSNVVAYRRSFSASTESRNIYHESIITSTQVEIVHPSTHLEGSSIRFHGNRFSLHCRTPKLLVDAYDSATGARIIVYCTGFGIKHISVRVRYSASKVDVSEATDSILQEMSQFVFSVIAEPDRYPKAANQTVPFSFTIRAFVHRCEPLV